jgi:D-glucuronyl C5-epimerase C-terminus
MLLIHSIGSPVEARARQRSVRILSRLLAAALAIQVAAGCGQTSSEVTATPSAPATAAVATTPGLDPTQLVSPMPQATPTPLPTPSSSPGKTSTPSPRPTPAPTHKPIPSPHLIAGWTQLPAYFRNWMPDPKATKDGAGVVMVNYGGSLGAQYSPTGVAQAALCYYDRWLVDAAAARGADWIAFMTQIDWLVANQLSDGRWLFHFKWGGMAVPWWSGMTDGVAISGLIRAYSLTGDKAVLTAITRARTTYERDQKTGHGIRSPVKVDSKTYYVYEEYLPGYTVGNVLNGWIFALVGLYEADKYLHDTKAGSLLRGSDSGFAAVKAMLPYYDTGNWSRYAAQPVTPPVGNLAKTEYHSLVVGQLWYLAATSGDATFSDWAQKWQGYLDACTAARKCPPPPLPQ